LAELEQSQTHSEWQQIQAIIKSHEQQMQERVGALRTAEQRLKDMENNALRLRKSSHVNSAQEYSTQHTDQLQPTIRYQLSACSY